MPETRESVLDDTRKYFEHEAELARLAYELGVGTLESAEHAQRCLTNCVHNHEIIKSLWSQQNAIENEE